MRLCILGREGSVPVPSHSHPCGPDAEAGRGQSRVPQFWHRHYINLHNIWSCLLAPFPCLLLKVLRIYRVSKKMSFLGKGAITIFKIIQNVKVGGLLENSGYLLLDGHWDFQNWWRNDWENETSSCQPPSKNGQNSLLSIYIDWSSPPLFRALWSLNLTH